MSTNQPTGDPKWFSRIFREPSAGNHDETFTKIAAAFEAILERDAETQRRLAALERVSGGAPGARGEETAAPTSALTTAELDVLVERDKQAGKWGASHDDGHGDGELADAAAHLAHTRGSYPVNAWAVDLKNRRDRRQQLVIASALCIAEIERLDRAEYSGDAASAKAASSTPEPGRVASPTSTTWTDEQRKTAHRLCHSTAFKLLHDHPLDYSHEHDNRLCEEIARIAPLFAPTKPAPSVEDCERAYIKAWAESLGGEASDATCHERAGIAAVRALMLESNKGDGGGAKQCVVEPHSSQERAAPTLPEPPARSEKVERAEVHHAKGSPPSSDLSCDNDPWTCKFCGAGPFTYDAGPFGWDAHWSKCGKLHRNTGDGDGASLKKSDEQGSPAWEAAPSPTPTPDADGLWRCENCGDAYEPTDSRWRVADVPEHACGPIPQCGNFRSRWFGGTPTPAPFAPDRDELADWMARSEPKFPSQWADVALAYFSRLIAERDALRKELADIARIAKETWPDMAEDRETALRRVCALSTRYEFIRDARLQNLAELDAFRARIAELEQERARHVLDFSNVDPKKLAVYDGSVIGMFLAHAGHGVGATDATLRAMGDELKAKQERIAELEARKPSSNAKRVTVSTKYLIDQVHGKLLTRLANGTEDPAMNECAQIAVDTVLAICAPQTAKRVLTRDEFDRFSLTYREATGTHDGGMRAALATIDIDVEGA